jgi:TonB family protein
MNASLFSGELATIRSRTRRCIWTSLAVHAVLLLVIILYRVVTPAPPSLVEITWIEAADPDVATNVTPTANQQPAKSPKTRQTLEQNSSFARETARGEIAPLKQDPNATADRMAQRLASLQREETKRGSAISALIDETGGPRLQLAGVPGTSRLETRPARLVRGKKTTNPAPLRRAEATPRTPPPALSRLPEKTQSPEPARPVEPTSRRDIAGASLMGPVADRRLLSYSTPSYPERAKREANEGTVKLYFTVLPDGRVKESIMIEKTSGFEDFDRNATTALRSWRFEPMKSGSTGEQWGSITFHYRLSDPTY